MSDDQAPVGVPEQALPLLLSIKQPAIRIDEIERTAPDGSVTVERWLGFLTPTMEFRVGPFDEEKWQKFALIVNQPKAAQDRARAGSKIVSPLSVVPPPT